MKVIHDRLADHAFTNAVEEHKKLTDEMQKSEGLAKRIEHLEIEVARLKQRTPRGVRKKVRRLVAHFHPDRCEECTPTEVSQALTTLLDEI